MSDFTTVYGLAVTESQTYGHGDYGSEEIIKREGSYGTGEFPPLFQSMDSARQWLGNRKEKWPTYKVVAMRLTI